MKNLFERTSSHWVWYSSYEWKKYKKGMLYLTAVQGAKLDHEIQKATEKMKIYFQKIILHPTNHATESL